MKYPQNMQLYATLSTCGTYRYTLKRWWDDELPKVLFVLLNPSTADAYEEDATSRRAIGYAQRWGYGMVTFCNLFAYRTPHPAALKLARAPVGPDNDYWLRTEIERHDLVVAAWGKHGGYQDRDKVVIPMSCRWQCFGLNNDGTPKHILYLPATKELQLFAARAVTLA